MPERHTLTEALPENKGRMTLKDWPTILAPFPKIYQYGPIRERPASRVTQIKKQVELFRYVRIERSYSELTVGHQPRRIEPRSLIGYFSKYPPQPEEDVYISLNQFVSPDAVTENLAVINALCLDLDFERLPDKAEPYNLDYLFEVCDGFGLPAPSLVISTGGGYHLAWLLGRKTLGRSRREKGRFSKDSYRFLKWFEQVVLRLQIALKPLGADPCYSTSANQMIRLPGSWNPLYGTRVELLHCNLNAITYLRAFEAIRDIEKNGSSQTAARRRRGQRRIRWWEHCPGYHKALAGVDESKPSRKLASFIVAVADFNQGLSVEEAVAHAHAVNCRHRPPLAENQVEAIVQNAYRRGYGFSCRRSCEKMEIPISQRPPARRAQQKAERSRRPYHRASDLVNRLEFKLKELGIERWPITIGLRELAAQLHVTDRQLGYALKKSGLGEAYRYQVEPTSRGRSYVFSYQLDSKLDETEKERPEEMSEGVLQSEHIIEG